MEIKLLLNRPCSDDDRISPEVIQELEDFAQVSIWDAPEDIDMDDSDDAIYGLWIEYGKGGKKTLGFRLSIDELEMFANSIQKSVEMIRRDYNEMIKARLLQRMHI